jgi:hypothetical protein
MGNLRVRLKITSVAENTTHFPSGDGTGSSSRFNFIMSSKVNGCLAVALGDGV